MSLVTLAIDDLRCIEHADLELHPGQNLIWGGNGSGKTSLLEAIFLLGRGRSFRTRNSERLIRYGRERLVVFGRVASAGDPEGWSRAAGPSMRDGKGGAASEARPSDTGLGRSASDPVASPGGIAGGARQSLELGADTAVDREIRAAPRVPNSGHVPGSGANQALGIQVSRAEGTIARINGSSAKSLTELTEIFPVQVIDPGIHKLLEEGGHRRRRWLDWGVFHVEHQFGEQWLRYARVVKQRNAALRSQPDQAAIWDPELARLGEWLAQARGRFVESLLPHWQSAVLALSGLEPELHYFKGWAQDVPLAEALKNSRARDQAKGITHPGPHRADLMIRLGGRPARERLSRGQQKLVAVAMTLAQLHLVQEATQTPSTLLLDDPAAELDGDHLRRFIEQVMRLRSQLVLTSLHPESQLFGTPDRVFHVEQGRVQPV